MKWMEVVRLRSERSSKKTSLLQILDELFLGTKERGLKRHFVYTSSEGRDVLILLTWNLEKMEKSRLGTVLATEMGQFGLVSHSTWQPWEKDSCHPPI